MVHLRSFAWCLAGQRLLEYKGLWRLFNPALYLMHQSIRRHLCAFVMLPNGNIHLIFEGGNQMMNSGGKKKKKLDFFVKRPFQNLPTAWLFGGRMIEPLEPRSRCMARVGPTETDLQRADPKECTWLCS